ncbi:apolipoprotein N-acyltransferase [Parvibium lacunae]|uniref:Apolipoprotein N-acyltransferase n=1 Tax=Parvibium lacunae TaxID=1888893 RepID=A0A368L4A2_9BURK|nr:apolipoprotein N-acyltransferase [Parvibium lacunae]RCS58411.1 apolipoprotein N-acyltransferase [Parvibium lacunae]
MQTYLVHLACALILGVLHSASFAPLEAWYLQALSLGGLYWLLQPRDQAPAVPPPWLLGLVFGLAWFGAGVSWIFISLYRYGQMPVWIAAPATFLFCLYLSLYPALFAALWSRFLARLHGSQGVAYQALLFGALWALTEWLRGTLFTGFPWLNTGYAHTVGPLRGYAPILGVYGLAWLSASLAALLALYWQARQHPAAHPRRQWYGAMMLLTGVLGLVLHWIPWTRAHESPITVRLLQGGIPQDTKFRVDRLNTSLGTYFGLIEEKPADLIALPETAFPLFWQDLPIDYQRRLQRFANAYQSHLITGIPLEEPPGYYTNSAVLFRPGASNGTVRFDARYDKHHLVPFGEFIPWGFRWFVDLMQMPLGDFGRGDPQQPPFNVAKQRIATNICYEDLFGEELRLSGRHATVLLNLSNLAWFGDTYALPQHLQISQMRALELRKPMLRATNTGMTAIIQADGQVTKKLLPFITATAEGVVQGRTGWTPYAGWGNAAFIGLLVAVFSYPFWRKRRARVG